MSYYDVEHLNQKKDYIEFQDVSDLTHTRPCIWVEEDVTP